MTIQHLYPTTRPSLDLNFARQKRLDPRVTFTRGSTATYVGSDGLIKTAADDEARFDYDPVTGESLGLLIEESRTNLAENSEDFNLWTTQNSTLLTAQGTAPDGTNTAFKIQEDTSTISHSIKEPSNSTWSGAATLSCFVKPAGRNFAFMGFTGVSQTSITFDLINKVSSYQGTNVTSGSVEDAGNGWLRIVAVFSSSITSGPAAVGPAESDSSGGLNYTGDGSSGILAWGAQLEAGSFPTSYIPTAGATLTRAVDIASMTGTNFSSWYNQSEGTVVATVFNFNSGGSNSIWSIDSGSSSNRWMFRVGSGVSVTNFDNVWDTANPYTATHACAVADNDIGYAKDGAPFTPGPTSTFLGGKTALNFGTGPGVGQATGHISRLAYYPTRLPDTQLQALTL